MDLRCQAKKWGEVWDASGLLDIKCNSRFCGAGKGIIVLHRFDLETGEMVSTQRFQAPPNRKNGGRNASHYSAAAVRSA